MPSIDDGYANAATTKAKVSYNGGGNQKTPAEKAADKERARLKKIEEQRANLSSEVNKSVRPATVIKSTAVTTAAGPIYKKTAYDIAADKAYLGNSGKGDRTVSPSITSLSSSAVPGLGSGENGPAGIYTPKANIMDGISGITTASYDGESALKEKESALNKAGLSSTVDGSAVRKRGNVDYSKSTSTDPNDGKNLSFINSTVAPVTNDKYNQEYYAKLKANGMSTANILDIQKQSIGGNAYSGATIVSEDQKRRANDTLSRVTGSMATLQNKGVTRKYTQSGLLGEFVKGEFNWKDGTNVTTLADDPVVRGTFNPKTGRIEGGFRLGSRQVTTFAGTGNYTGATAGTGASTTGESYAVNTMSGGEDGLGGGAKTTTLTAKQSATLTDVTSGKVKLDDIVDSTTIIKAITTVPEIDKLIEETTDPDILKSLYQRRLSLMRLRRTRTRFAGLLDDADTKRTNLMSIS